MKNNQNNQSLISEAITKFQYGRCDEALNICHKILVDDPLHLGAIQLVGAIALQKGDFEGALDFFIKALSVEPQNEKILANQGLALSGLKRFDEALQSLNQAIALNPHFPEPYYNKATVLIKLKRLEEALTYLDRYITLKPENHLAIFLKSDIYRKLGQLELATLECRKLITLQPNNISALTNLGLLLSDQEKYEDALFFLNEAKLLNSNAEIFNNIGVTYERMGQYHLAIENFSEALKLKPDSIEVLINCGVTLERLGKLDDAITYANRIIELDEKNEAGYFGRAACYEKLQHLEKSIADYTKVIELNSTKKHGAQWNRSLVMLCQGNYAQGWQEYEHRLEIDYAKNLYNTDQLREFAWHGNASQIRGKNLLVRSEQGLGDTIQFCRYIKYLHEMQARVTFRVQKPLIKLLEHVDGVASIVSDTDPMPNFDLYCNLMSLPLLLKTTVDTIPNQTPYLQADPFKVKEWAQRLGPKINKRVGLVWSGGFRPDRPDLWLLNRRRNIELIKLRSLKTEGIEFHSLQKGELPEAELVVQHLQNWDGPQLINHADALLDFTDTAALLENLDLLISVDTSVLHVAGALGKPVWLLNRFDTCWRWFLERDDSPWYPSIRIFRQKSFDDWDPVILEVKEALRTFANS